ncbi:MAG: nucleotidyltransferase domain-containing protein [Candidatus Omnitrophota bacterium]
MGVRLDAITNYAKKIKQRFHPEEIILFGSYAVRRASKDSDVDLLVIMETKRRPVEQAVLIRKELPSPFPLDLMVRKPKDIKERIKEGDFFLKAILETGKRL